MMRCCYPGCKTESRHNASPLRQRYIAHHRQLPHWACGCGWVGPYPNKHRAQMRRNGDMSEHVAHVLDPSTARTEYP